MRFLLLVTIGTVLLRAAAPGPEDPDVLRARLAIERLAALVEAGAIPRVQLEQAEDALGDAQDMAVLRRTMYGQDITEEQAGEMVAAAQRRFDRRQKQLDRARGLVDSGIAAKNDLGPLEEQVDFARKEHELAVSRANLNHELVEMARAELKYDPANPVALLTAAQTLMTSTQSRSDTMVPASSRPPNFHKYPPPSSVASRNRCP